jgi:hypothetical protein
MNIGINWVLSAVDEGGANGNATAFDYNLRPRVVRSKKTRRHANPD